jgi:hypothetical protein
MDVDTPWRGAGARELTDEWKLIRAIGLLVSRKDPTAAAKGAQHFSMRFLAVMPICLIALSCGAIAAESQNAPAQGGSVLVNGEVIGAEEIIQRVRLINLNNHFGDRMRAALGSDEIKQTLRERIQAANPRNQDETHAAAERIKAEMIVEVRKRLLVEGGVTRKEAVNALVADRLKLQAAKKLGIEITDEEVEAADKARANGLAWDMGKLYAQLEEAGICRKTVWDIIRARLAYRALFIRYYRERDGCTFGPLKHYAHSCLKKLEQEARIEYRDL